MSNNIKIISIILFGIIALYIFKINSNHNLKKTIQACVIAKKQTSESFNVNQAKKFCESEIRKQLGNSK